MNQKTRNQRLTFNEETHTYYLDGVKIPGVTSVLGEFVYVEYHDIYVCTTNGQVIAGEIMRRAADIGSAVHKVLELVLLHGIDAVYYPPEIDPAVKALVQWQKDYRPEIVCVEKRVVSTKYGFAGTLDILAYMPMTKRLSLTDAKTGLGLLTGPQTAAYEKAYREETGERKIIDRHKLRLPKQEGGSYQFIPLKNPQDWQFFQNKLFSSRYLAAL